MHKTSAPRNHKNNKNFPVFWDSLIAKTVGFHKFKIYWERLCFRYLQSIFDFTKIWRDIRTLSL